MTPLENLTITAQQTIREAILKIDRNVKGIVLLVDEAGRLHATVTDGDIRRGILAGISIDSPLAALLEHKTRTAARRQPMTAPADTPPAKLLSLMSRHQVRQMPLIDTDGRIVSLITLDELVRASDDVPVRAVIMAGGFGKRLLPLTEDTPKPMLPVGDKPLMEIIVDQLRQAGIHRLNVTTHFKPEKIVNHFGDGSRFGVQIDYINEDRPMGTAGALSLLPQGDEPVLVINGDILTRVDFRALVEYHRSHQADMTIGVRQYEMNVPYGVVEIDNERVTQLREKPQLRFLVNAGVYLLQPATLASVDTTRRFDMTDLIQRLVADGRTVVSFPIIEYWMDIGQHHDYQRVQQDQLDLQRAMPKESVA